MLSGTALELGCLGQLAARPALKIFSTSKYVILSETKDLFFGRGKMPKQILRFTQDDSRLW